MAFVEDGSLFYGPNDPGVSAATWNGSTVYGHLNRAYVDEFGAEGTGIAFDCWAANIVGIAHGDTVVIDGTTYVYRGRFLGSDDAVAIMKLQA